MIKNKHMACVALLATIAFSSCQEDALTIGNSLTNENDVLNITSTNYYATTRTIVADSVLSLSSDCYFGKIKDPETGSNVTSEFTTQFNILESTYISPDSNFVSRYEGKASADSCDIILYLTNPFLAKDSLTAMKMSVWELDRPAEEGTRYYSNYDPVAQHLIRTDGIHQSKMFTFTNLTDKDSLRATTTYLNNIRIGMNMPYTDKQGNVYNNYGTYILRQFHEHNEYFKNSYTFSHNVCPGFYFEVVDGLGFHSKVSNIGLRIYYRVKPDTAAYNASLTLAGTQEVIQTIHVTNDKAAIQALATDNSCTYLKSPAGLFTEVTLPVDEILAAHANDSLLATRITFQRINNESFDERALGIPSNILMVPKDSLNSFFEKDKIPDSKLSYYAAFTTSMNIYSFSNISNLITELWRLKQEGIAGGDANWASNHPNWNKVVLVPVTVTTNSSTYAVTNIEHDMSLRSTKLVGGSEPISLSVVYAKFNK